MVEDSGTIDSGKVKFRPKARLLHLLGHELITDEVIAMIELVKNSYDADAIQVDVKLIDITKKDKGIIEIRDDGHGMPLERVKEAWMEPARENKKDEKGIRQRTKKFGRLPLGEKGVGRFSVDKLGLKLEVITRYCEFDRKTKGISHLSDEEVVLIIEGKKFTEDSYLDEIECEWITRKPSDFKGEEHGTLLRISGLRTEWSGELVEKVRLGLSRLSSPTSEAKDFRINLDANEFPELSAEIENPLLKIAPWFLEAEIDDNGVMKYSIKGPDKADEGEKDLRIGSDHFLIRKGEHRKPVCGPFKFKHYAFERERKQWKKFGLDREKIALLNDLCGVSIYRDGFRVLPYGEKGNDWLYFDKRRIQAPGRIFGNDRVIGYVEISQESNPLLKDKTNREGLIEEGQVFNDLRELAINATHILETFRFVSLPHKRRSRAKAEEAKEDIETGSKEVEEISFRTGENLDFADREISEGNIGGVKSHIERAREEVRKSEPATHHIREGTGKLLEELSLSEEQINDLVSLAGIGMTAERMTHELSQAAGNAKEMAREITKLLEKGRADILTVKRNLTSISGQLEIIIDHIRQLEPLYYSRRRSTEELDVGDIARSMEKFYAGTIRKLGIKVEITEKSKLRVEMNKGHLLQVFNNLLDNSFFWLEHARTQGQPRITIEVTRKPEKTIIFADNGSGIDRMVESHLFDPFVTTKPDGRGLGLYIVNDILQNYKAEIEILTEGKILGGANFKITFPEEK